MTKMANVLAVLLLAVAACATTSTDTPGSTPTTTTSTRSEKVVGSTIEQHILLRPDAVTWGAGPPTLQPGAMMAVIEGDPKAADALFTIRLKLPDGHMISPHFHPADEHITVISGTFRMGMGDVFDKGATTPLPAGSFAVMPKSHTHFAWAEGETVIQVHGVGPWGITYVNPADDPRHVKTN